MEIRNTEQSGEEWSVNRRLEQTVTGTNTSKRNTETAELVSQMLPTKTSPSKPLTETVVVCDSTNDTSEKCLKQEKSSSEHSVSSTIVSRTTTPSSVITSSAASSSFKDTNHLASGSEHSPNDSGDRENEGITHCFLISSSCTFIVCNLHAAS